MNESLSVDFADRHANHTLRLIHDLSQGGWTPRHFPANAMILPNRQLVELHTPHRSIRLRVSLYAVGNRGEPHRLNERRIEITTTRVSGLRPLRQWADVVLGYDRDNDAYVGLDPRRLSLGGRTHNASSSVDPTALLAASASRILIQPSESPSLGLEYQAIFRPERLSEYLFNYEAIHGGPYLGDGLFSGHVQHGGHRGTWSLPLSACSGKQLVLTHQHPAKTRKLPVSAALAEAYETGDVDMLTDLSPDDLEVIRRACREIGDRGERFVYDYERRRLHKGGRSDLVDKITWVSQKSVGKGYDISSFDMDGSPRFIEVKTTAGGGSTFFMSNNEWTTATMKRASYWIYRVVGALNKPSLSAKIQDPVAAEETSAITRIPDGWRVTITMR
jgi:hypothetical protein